MSAPTIEQLFGRALLEIHTPSKPFSLKQDGAGDELLAELVSDSRSVTFYDERLELAIALKVPYAGGDASSPPPVAVLSGLARTQISLEASYIASYPQSPTSPALMTSKTNTMPRSSSLRPGSSALPTSLQPPTTPNPTPSTGEFDKKYMRSEGLTMASLVWGESSPVVEEEQFMLFWSQRERAWVALYRMEVAIAYLRTRSPDPALCLTVSATLRDKALPWTRARLPLQTLLQAANVQVSPEAAQIPYMTEPSPDEDDEEAEVSRFEEVNLFEGLQGPSFSSLSEEERSLRLPSTRLSQGLRKELFSLSSPESDSPPVSAVPTPVTGRQIAVLRKSFRKVLPVVSGIKVRMRTTFVPRASDEEDDEPLESEKAVILCVEIENSGEAAFGFFVEKIDVNISGNDSTTCLIGWDENDTGLFPLKLQATDQCNLLYSVSFLDGMSKPPDPSLQPPRSSSRRRSQPLAPTQRSVSIVVHGRPFLSDSSSPGGLSYQTGTFPSIWNCQIDVAPAQQGEVSTRPRTPLTDRDALPTPVSPHRIPFFSATATGGALSLATSFTDAFSPPMSEKRHTIGDLADVSHRLKFPSDRPARPHPARSFTLPTATTTSVPLSASASQRFGNTPPASAMRTAHVVAGAGFMRAPSAPILSTRASAQVPPLRLPPHLRPPEGGRSSAPPIPSASSSVARRVSFPAGPGRQSSEAVQAAAAVPAVEGEPVLISIALSYPRKGHSNTEAGSRRDGQIFPLDTFSLEIFVFNQSSVSRRLVFTYPDDRTLARSPSTPAAQDVVSTTSDKAGFVPLENFKQVGPLEPGTCQSIEMPFLALRPGVHTVEVLTVRDLDTAHVINLRQVTTLVVHEVDALK